MRSPRFALLAPALLALGLAACDGGSGSSQCTDGADNDADGLIDDADPSCAGGGDTEDADDPVRDCNDDVDNDDDGLVDFPEDPGCTDGQDNSELNSPVPACDDGADNDGDGLSDYPQDPGCSSPLQNTEDDDCPDGVGCPQCGNGMDDDGDGDVDYPDDEGCTAASDNGERTADPTACAQLPYEQLPQSGLAPGVLVAGTSVISSAVCGGAGAEKAFEMYIESPVVMVATTDLTGTAFDTILYVRERCGDMTTELACNDDANADTRRSTLTVALDPGFYYLIVDGDTAGSVGGFQLQVQFFPGLGTACDPAETNACAPGLLCRTVAGASSETCEYPVCNDGRDDDGDLIADYPEDPGCASQGDSTENDGCPTTNCPACADGADNDGDGETDYPLDLDCSFAGQVAEGCGPETDMIFQITDDTFVGNSTGMTNNSTVTGCGSTGGVDVVHFLTLPVAVQSLDVDTNNSAGMDDTILYMDDATCDGVYLSDTNSSPPQCDDDAGTPNYQSRQVFGALPAGTYAIVVDGYSSSEVGAYNLNVHGVAVPSAACTDPLFTNGLLACPSDYPCDGSICAPPDCGNTVDDDGDGKVGYPTDPGCTTALDADETDDCPNGTGCPKCGNGMDDDLDGATDYPDDINCTSASSNTEACGDVDPIGQITGPITTGTTLGLAGNLGGTCGSTLAAPDKVYLLDLPAPAVTLTIDTVGSAFDTVLMMKSPACEATDIACDDNTGGNSTSRITRTNQAAGTYAIVVDGKTTTGGAFTLNVSGTVGPGAACNSPLFPSGALSCSAGEFCNGVMCVATVCNNAVDDDGDGKVGYPSDPGCTSTSDTTEEDTCPSGGSCPRCGNATDDDADGVNNYPADPNCIAASTDDESGCASASDAYVEITGPTTTGNLDTEGNDFVPSCQASSGRDAAFELNVPYPLQSLYVDTDASSVNTVAMVRANGCNTADLACDNNSGQDSTDSWLALGATAAGRYAVIVDSTSGATGAFTLHVKGVIAQGGACSPALETAGLFVCNATSHCSGAIGAEVCTPKACSNGGDDDGDGKADATDPGCLSGADDTEADPGTLPECANAGDDDGDGLNNYPADPGCRRAGDPLEFIPAESSGVTELTTARVSGTTAGAGHDFTPTCAAASGAPERVYSITIPGTMSTLTFNAALPPLPPLTGFDSVLHVKRTTAGTALTDVGCGDNPVVTLSNAPAGTYFIIVDGWATNEGSFQLGVWGTITSGQACDAAQIQAGLFTCATGTACRDSICQP